MSSYDSVLTKKSFSLFDIREFLILYVKKKRKKYLNLLTNIEDSSLDNTIFLCVLYMGKKEKIFDKHLKKIMIPNKCSYLLANITNRKTNLVLCNVFYSSQKVVSTHKYVLLIRKEK
jgi:hypothetical protein